MADDKIPKISLNIFLLKLKSDKSLWTKGDFLSKEVNATGRSKQIRTTEHVLVQDGETLGTLYIRPFTENHPDWVNFIAPAVPDSATLKPLKNRSVSAILVTQTAGRQFILAFGHGRHMIDHGAVEYRFGIKTVLNSVEPTEIVSIDSQTFDATPKLSRTQTLKKSPIADYGVDPSKDLLRAIAGQVKKEYASLGTVVAGMDSFKTVVPVQLKDLHKILNSALKRSQSKDYQQAVGGRDGAFAWIDKLQHITDPALVDDLNAQLWADFLAESFTTMWMAIPDIIDWEGTQGFAYTPSQAKEKEALASALDIKEFKETFNSKATFDTLKHRTVYLVHAADGRQVPYSAYRCIYAEVAHSGLLYVLNAGNWYQVEKSFEQQVNTHFQDLVTHAVPFVAPFLEYNHKDEGAYNKAVVAGSSKALGLLDRKQIQYGGNHSSIEVCDLYKKPTPGTEKGQLIHVKRGRSSSTLSHLFAQGLTSSTLLRMDQEFVTEVNLQLAKQRIPHLPAIPAPSDYEVVFAIIDGPAGCTLGIPFFSKVNLQNSARLIRAFGFDVRLLHIPESAKHIAKVTKRRVKKKTS